MKYIPAEKLIAEIENMFDKGYYCTPKNIGKQQGRNKVCREILSLITSLQQEQPEVDLEKVIEQTYHDGSVADTSDMDHVDYENIARHFYELGLNARKK